MHIYIYIYIIHLKEIKIQRLIQCNCLCCANLVALRLMNFQSNFVTDPQLNTVVS